MNQPDRPVLNEQHHDLNALEQIVHRYFEGLYHGDVEKLRSIFDDHAQLQAPGLRRNREQWLQAVGSRPTPEGRDDPFAFRILAIEIVGAQALAKVDCPLMGNHYIDYLGLLKENGRWRIVNKMYADYPQRAIA